MTSMEHDDQMSVEKYIQERRAWLDEAVVAVGAEQGSDPLQVFTAPGEVRMDDEGVALDEEQEANLREIAGRFGIGGEQDIASTAEYQVIEGGLAWKVSSEIAISQGSSLLLAGSPNRIIKDNEKTFLGALLTDEEAEEDISEYDMVRRLISSSPDFEPLEFDDVLPFGYEIAPGFSLIEEATGQLVRIGTYKGRDVTLLRVDREDFINEEGENKYRNQPDSAAIMGVVADVLTATGDESSSVGILTSNTYSSRAIDVLRAGVTKGRRFDMGLYGRETLAGIKGEEVSPTAINQIPGELHVIAEKLASLEAEA